MKNPDILKRGDKVILSDADWSDVNFYRIEEVSEFGAKIIPFNYLLDGAEVLNLERPEAEKIFLSPYTPEFSKRNLLNFMSAQFIKDLASTHLRKNIRMEVEDLVGVISTESRSKKIPKEYVVNCLKCCVGDGSFIVQYDKRKREKTFNLELSLHQIDVEKRREFAGSLASELTSLSERIRKLIAHTSSVGTYRENILQSLLKKHIPERYHVATGFIYGCQRQIDILIYDRIEYAPLFREGDLVVVPPEAVRAVIEVKTNITATQLSSSLKLIHQASLCDNCFPPFFKGIFGFESDLNSDDINAKISEFYNKEYGDFDEFDEDGMYIITNPYRHLTSLCVLEKAYSEVQIERVGEPNRYRPALCFATSATGLNSQVTHFLQRLLSYLKFDGIKPSKSNDMLRMLGADSKMDRFGYLTPESWGAYFMLENRGSEEDEMEVNKLEAIVSAANAWVWGGTWVPPRV
jgi:hypothetical protein